QRCLWLPRVVATHHGDSMRHTSSFAAFCLCVGVCSSAFAEPPTLLTDTTTTLGLEAAFEERVDLLLPAVDANTTSVRIVSGKAPTTRAAIEARQLDDAFVASRACVVPVTGGRITLDRDIASGIDRSSGNSHCGAVLSDAGIAGQRWLVLPAGSARIYEFEFKTKARALDEPLHFTTEDDV